MTRPMKWQKLGMVFCPSGETDWMFSHASVPIAESMGDDRYKIYFSTRDKLNRSSTGYVVIDIGRPNEIIDLSTKPVLSPGNIGEFDDSGAMATWLAERDEKRYLTQVATYDHHQNPSKR